MLRCWGDIGQVMGRGHGPCTLGPPIQPHPPAPLHRWDKPGTRHPNCNGLANRKRREPLSLRGSQDSADCVAQVSQSAATAGLDLQAADKDRGAGGGT